MPFDYKSIPYDEIYIGNQARFLMDHPWEPTDQEITEYLILAKLQLDAAKDWSPEIGAFYLRGFHEVELAKIWKETYDPGVEFPYAVGVREPDGIVRPFHQDLRTGTILTAQADLEYHQDIVHPDSTLFHLVEMTDEDKEVVRHKP